MEQEPAWRWGCSGGPVGRRTAGTAPPLQWNKKPTRRWGCSGGPAGRRRRGTAPPLQWNKDPRGAGDVAAALWAAERRGTAPAATGDSGNDGIENSHMDADARHGLNAYFNVMPTGCISSHFARGKGNTTCNRLDSSGFSIICHTRAECVWDSCWPLCAHADHLHLFVRYRARSACQKWVGVLKNSLGKNLNVRV
jgi:hypothetical protein